MSCPSPAGGGGRVCPVLVLPRGKVGYVLSWSCLGVRVLLTPHPQLGLVLRMGPWSVLPRNVNGRLSCVADKPV